MFEPSVINWNIADGQLAATATQLTAGPGNRARRLNVLLGNTGTQDETIILTLSRNGGTARRVWYGVLSPNWQARICGLPINGTDSLLGQSTDAAVVDYLVSNAADEAPLTMAVYNDSGMLASAPQVIDQLAMLTG